MKNLIIIVSQMSVFGGYDHKCMANEHFDRLSLSNGKWQDMWGG